ncbi:MAG: hypothetical protein ACRENP_04150 [Longimicrobiales bacterium]
MQAQIDTRDTCDGTVTLRTSVRQSDWGAADAEFEAYGGGTARGISMGIHRARNAERVDFEEEFSLDTCHATFRRCHLITFDEGGTKYTFAEAVYQPDITATSEPQGTEMHDATPAPRLIVRPCNAVTPTFCR